MSGHRLIPLLVLLASLLYSDCELETLNLEQKRVMAKTYIKAKPYGLELQFMAIAWQESKFGKEPINLNDPSCGVFHNLIDTVMDYNGFSRTNNYLRNSVCAKLIKDFDYSFHHALEVVLFFMDYHKGDWRKAIASYNAGFRTTSGTTYLQAILSKMSLLKIFIENHKGAFSELDDVVLKLNHK